ncbi:MAG: DNA-3-methyladenine glycosylase [Mesorhizobium sp.]
MRRIANMADVEAALDELCRIDPRLTRVREASGEIELRLTQPGFASLVSIVISQMVSRASAAAILSRFSTHVVPMTAEAVLVADEDVFRLSGFSRPKQRTVLALARAVADDGLDLEHLCTLEADEAIARLTAVSGIGPWTAQVYLLFAAGHPDVFPDKDVALQSAVGHAFGIAPRPGDRALASIAEEWAPWRGVAARLFWAYYRDMKGRDSAPVLEALARVQAT